MALKGERTDITYDEKHRIVQLDAHIPELEANEAIISIDLGRFSRSHPLRGIPAITQSYDGIDESAPPYIVAQVSRETDLLNFEDGLDDPIDAADSEHILFINQHVKKMGSRAVAVAVVTYDMEQAILDLPEALKQPVLAADLLDDYGYGPSAN